MATFPTPRRHSRFLPRHSRESGNPEGWRAGDFSQSAEIPRRKGLTRPPALCDHIRTDTPCCPLRRTTGYAKGGALIQ